jgi:hypothetical protein
MQFIRKARKLHHNLEQMRGKKQTSSSGMPLMKRSSSVRKIGPMITSHSALLSIGVDATKIPHQSNI